MFQGDPALLVISSRSHSTATSLCLSFLRLHQAKVVKDHKSMHSQEWIGNLMLHSQLSLVSILHHSGLEQPGYSRNTLSKASDSSTSLPTWLVLTNSRFKMLKVSFRQFSSSRILTHIISRATIRTRLSSLMATLSLIQRRPTRSIWTTNSLLGKKRLPGSLLRLLQSQLTETLRLLLVSRLTTLVWTTVKLFVNWNVPGTLQWEALMPHEPSADWEFEGEALNNSRAQRYGVLG